MNPGLALTHPALLSHQSIKSMQRLTQTASVFAGRLGRVRLLDPHIILSAAYICLLFAWPITSEPHPCY